MWSGPISSDILAYVVTIFSLSIFRKKQLARPLTEYEHHHNSKLTVMKKIRLFLASTLLLGAFAVFGQDSTKVSEDATDQTSGPGVGAQQGSQTDDFRKDMTVMEKRQVPANLRSTLQGEQYKGWEDNATIYRTRNNDSFIVEMKEGDQVKLHRFDQNGKPVKDF
jgi:hypothetical protein